MIKKIILSLFLGCLFIAIPLSLAGIHRVSLSDGVISFLQNCSRELNDFKVEIPQIPKIPTINVGFLDVLINFINGFVILINFVITLVNIIIQLLEFLFIIIKNLITLKDYLAVRPV